MGKERVDKAESGETGFAQRLRALRLAANLSRAALAEKAAVPAGTIRNLEQGRQKPNWATVLSLADALGIKVDEFRSTDLEETPRKTS